MSGTLCALRVDQALKNGPRYLMPQVERRIRFRPSRLPEATVTVHLTPIFDLQELRRLPFLVR